MTKSSLCCSMLGTSVCHQVQVTTMTRKPKPYLKVLEQLPFTLSICSHNLPHTSHRMKTSSGQEWFQACARTLTPTPVLITQHFETRGDPTNHDCSQPAMNITKSGLLHHEMVWCFCGCVARVGNVKEVRVWMGEWENQSLDAGEF